MVNRKANLSLILVITMLMITTAFSTLNEDEIERYLKQINKPAVKSIKIPDGDIIDCVDIYNQLAFDNPLLKNHTIQMKPSSFPKDLPSTSYKQSEGIVTQLWHKYGECPENTVPVRRTTREDILRWRGPLETFGKKTVGLKS
ncbi:PREDICTED: uncharacterized protein LOC104808435 [Tarenaya hassleriana]|uniref:uncharacterized protein LOC104808435 n=1 Tax=Tarenaya hassleriana TaxID=28532 RepID=UPI00053C0EA5|nr:PREDICTED: uncharacterized protein LOC104808435 [Tarenaya hassleriana]